MITSLMHLFSIFTVKIEIKSYPKVNKSQKQINHIYLTNMLDYIE